MNRELVIKKSVQICAPVENVWEALVNPELTKKYVFGLEVYSDWIVGSPIVWKSQGENGKVMRKGKVIAIEPMSILQITDAAANDKTYSRITYELCAENENTVLTVTESDLDDTARLREDGAFWDRMLPALKTLLENSENLASR